MKKITYSVIAIVSILLLITGCSIGYEDAKGTMIISMEDNSRGIGSDISSETSSYDITATHSKSGTVITSTIIDKTTEVFNDMEIGSWTISVDAKNKDGIVIGSGSTTCTVKDGEVSKCTVTVTEKEGTGILTISITRLPSDPILFTIRIVKGSTDVIKDTVSSQGGSLSKDYELANGSYKIFITPSGTTEVSAIAETARIVTGGTSTFAYALGSTGSFEIINNIPKTPTIELKLPAEFMQTKTYTLEATVENAPAGYSAQWYFDGIALSSNSLTLSADEYAVGSAHMITYMVSSGNIVWSESANFTVAERSILPVFTNIPEKIVSAHDKSFTIELVAENNDDAQKYNWKWYLDGGETSFTSYNYFKGKVNAVGSHTIVLKGTNQTTGTTTDFATIPVIITPTAKYFRVGDYLYVGQEITAEGRMSTESSDYSLAWYYKPSSDTETGYGKKICDGKTLNYTVDSSITPIGTGKIYLAVVDSAGEIVDVYEDDTTIIETPYLPIRTLYGYEMGTTIKRTRPGGGVGFSTIDYDDFTYEWYFNDKKIENSYGNIHQFGSYNVRNHAIDSKLTVFVKATDANGTVYTGEKAEFTIVAADPYFFLVGYDSEVIMAKPDTVLILQLGYIDESGKYPDSDDYTLTWSLDTLDNSDYADRFIVDNPNMKAKFLLPEGNFMRIEIRIEARNNTNALYDHFYKYIIPLP